MFRSVGRFIWRMTKSVIGVGAVGFLGYYTSWGLNWLTTHIVDFLEMAARYLMGNWKAVILVVLALTLGGMAFDGVAGAFKKKKKPKKKKVVKKEDDMM